MIILKDYNSYELIVMWKNIKIKGQTLTIALGVRIAINEMWCWYEAFFRWIPGRIGRLIRFLVYLPFIRSEGKFLIPEYVHIWEPWKMRCGKNVRFGRFSQVNCL